MPECEHVLPFLHHELYGKDHIYIVRYLWNYYVEVLQGKRTETTLFLTYTDLRLIFCKI